MALNVNIKSLESFSVIIKIIVQRMKCLFVQIEASHIAHHNKPWSPYSECGMGVLLLILPSGRQLASGVIGHGPLFGIFHHILTLHLQILSILSHLWTTLAARVVLRPLKCRHMEMAFVIEAKIMHKIDLC